MLNCWDWFPDQRPTFARTTAVVGDLLPAEIRLRYEGYDKEEVQFNMHLNAAYGVHIRTSESDP